MTRKHARFPRICRVLSFPACGTAEARSELGEQEYASGDLSPTLSGGDVFEAKRHVFSQNPK